VNRALLAAAAALIVVVAGAALILRPASNVGPPASPTAEPTPLPTTQPSPSAPSSRGVVPAELLRTWVGAPRLLPGLATPHHLNFGFDFGQLVMRADYSTSFFDSPARFTGTNMFELTALANGCDVGLVGHYTWSLSPRGTLLHLEALDDACTARSDALAGDWHAANCKDPTDVCWGDLEAGTYPTLFYGPRLSSAQGPAPNYGGVTFTVPDGWAVGGDHTSDFRLLRSSDYAKEGRTGPVGQPTEIEAWIRPTVNNLNDTCAVAPASKADESPQELAGWLRNALRRQPALTTTDEHSITIDGHAGLWLDFSVSPGWTQTCPGSTEPTVPLFTEAVGSAGPVGSEPYLISISGKTRMRAIFLDVSEPAPKATHTAMILIAAPDQATFDAFVDEAMPIVQSFHFK
jgi:hypothetical protein